jgi:nucleotide-binding universal stress UspA family protein
MTDSITKILVPVDFSPHAERAFQYAMALAQRSGARLELLHVMEDPFVTGAWSLETYVPNVVELLQELVDGAERRLTTMKQSATARGVATEIAVITGGRPAHTIVEFAEQGGFDLIVMGTHGRTGVAHVVIGSVAERVVRRAPCPVLTLRAEEAAATRKKSAA